MQRVKLRLSYDFHYFSSTQVDYDHQVEQLLKIVDHPHRLASAATASSYNCKE